ncbi:hypothetical protein ACIQYZ_10925 [Rhodococcus erythropolis]
MSGAVLTVRVPVDFTPDDIRYTDSGGFDASNCAAMLSRRPRSAQGWEPKWGVPHYAWSTPLWDWAATVGLGSRDLATVDRNLHHLRDNPELIARTALVVEQVVVNPEGRNDDIVLCRESLCEFGSGEIVVSGHGLPFASNRRDRLHRLHHGLGSAAIDHPPRMI